MQGAAKVRYNVTILNVSSNVQGGQGKSVADPTKA